MGKQHCKKVKKGFHEMEVHEDKKRTQTGQEYTQYTDTSWDHADNWTDADWWSSRKTVANDATGSRTVQSNACRKHFNVRWFDDVRVVSQ